MCFFCHIIYFLVSGDLFLLKWILKFFKDSFSSVYQFAFRTGLPITEVFRLHFDSAIDQKYLCVPMHSHLWRDALRHIDVK